MALAPTTLAQAIENIISGANPDASPEAQAQFATFSTQLATAIDAYIKTATVTVTTACGSGPGTGTGVLS